jgi:alkylhydroperoxidase family enzyme
MAWIQVISPEEASGELAAHYRRMCEPDGSVDNILTVHSLNPRSLLAHYDLYKVCMYGPSDLSRAQREMVAVVVSVINHCDY